MADQKARIVISAVDQTQAAFASVERGISEMETALGTAMGKMGSLGALLATAVSGHTLASTIEVADKLDDLSQKTGISAEKLSELRYAAEVAGTPFEALAVGIRKLSINASAAAGGNKEMAEMFAKMGVAVTDSGGKIRSTDAILEDVISSFGGYKASADKTALAVKAFGKSGEELIPILDLGKLGLQGLRKEARDLGAVYSNDLAKASGEFNDNLKKLSLMAEAGANSLLEYLVPKLEEVTQDFIDAEKAYGSLWQAFIDYPLKGNTKELSELAKNIQDTQREVDALTDSLAKAKAAGGDKAGGFLGFLHKSDIAVAEERLDRLTGRLAKLKMERDKLLEPQLDSLGKPKELKDAPRTGGNDGNTKTQASEYDKLIQRLRAKLEVEKEEQKLGRDLTAGEREHMAALGELQAIMAKDPSNNGTRARKLIEEIFALTQVNEAEKERSKAQKALQADRDREAAASAEELARMVNQTHELQQQIEEFGLTERQLVKLKDARLENALAIEEERLADMRKFAAEGPAIESQKARIDQLRQQFHLQRMLNEAAASQRDNPYAGAMAALDDYMEHVQHAGESTKDAVKSALDGLEQNLTSFFATGKAGWAEYVQFVLKEMVRLTTVQPMVNALAGAVTSYFGGAGATTSYSGVGTQAMGTSMGALGLSGGRSIYEGATPVAKAMAAGPSASPAVVVQQQTNHYGSNVSRAEVAEGQRQANAELEWKIMRSRKYGGAL